jgi:hypothetical protein
MFATFHFNPCARTPLPYETPLRRSWVISVAMRVICIFWAPRFFPSTSVFPRVPSDIYNLEICGSYFFNARPRHRTSWRKNFSQSRHTVIGPQRSGWRNTLLEGAENSRFWATKKRFWRTLACGSEHLLLSGGTAYLPTTHHTQDVSTDWGKDRTNIELAEPST